MPRTLKSNIRIGNSDWIEPAPANPPIVGDDGYSALTGGSNMTLNVLANDSDPAGGTLSIVAVEPATLGTVSIVDNKLVYDIGTAGTDQFQYTVQSSASGLQSSGTVTITVAEPGSATLTIATNRPSDGSYPYAYAPGGFMFSAQVEGHARNALHYKWSFEDPGWYTRHDTNDLPWDRYYLVDSTHRRICRGPDVYDPDGNFIETGTLIPGEGFRPTTGSMFQFLGNDRNIAYGPEAAHVFPPDIDFGGADYVIKTVTCEARTSPDGPPLAVGMLDVKILNTAKLCAGTRTILVTSGDKTNPNDPKWRSDLYPGAFLANSHGEGHASIGNQSVAGPIRILFEAGVTHQLTTKQNQKHNTGKITALIYGVVGESGAWDYRGDLYMNATAHSNTENALYACSHLGPYDPTDPFVQTNTPETSGKLVDGIYLGGAAFKTLWDCESSGWFICYTGESDESLNGAKLGFTNAIIGNCIARNWGNFGFYAHNDYRNDPPTGPYNTGFCGVWAKQPYGTVNARGRDEYDAGAIGGLLFPDHGPWRSNVVGSPSSFNLIDFRSLNDWSGPLQPCWRWNGGTMRCNGDTKPPRYTVDRGRFEGGSTGQRVSSASGMPGIHQYSASETYWDKIYHVHYGGTDKKAFYFNTPGGRLSNGIFVFPDIPPISNKPEAIVAAGSANWQGSTKWEQDTGNYEVDVFSNTAVDLRTVSDSDAPWLGFINPEPTTWALNKSNNLEHRPSKGADLGLDPAALWTVDFPGIRQANHGQANFGSTDKSNTIEVKDGQRTINIYFPAGASFSGTVVLEYATVDSNNASYTVVETYTGWTEKTYTDTSNQVRYYRLRRTSGSGGNWGRLWAFPSPNPFPYDTRFAMPAAKQTAGVFAPQPGSPAYQSATGRVAVDDFFGRLRTGTPSQGALEPI